MKRSRRSRRRSRNSVRCALWAIAPRFAPLRPIIPPASWHSISTAAGVPKEIVDKLAKEIRAVMDEPDVKQLLSNEGAIPQVSPSPEEFKKFVDSEIVRWGKLVEQAGILHSQ